LVLPFINALGRVTNLRTEVIAGKTVYRFSPYGFGDVGPDAIQDLYAYAFDDLAIFIMSRRPEEAREALRALP
jgi:hypothetical protein